MRALRPLTFAALAFAAAIAHGQAVSGNWTPTWSDEFNVGASDLNGWDYDLGDGTAAGNPGWGNNEKEVYTNSAQNSYVFDGALHLAAIATGTGADQTYTSARLKSDTLFSQAYGLFEFRAKLPVGQGLWPALWMMPEDNAYGGWPTSGEIDVMESRGQDQGLVQGSLHSGAAWNATDNQTGFYNAPAGFSTADWHTYDLAWSKGSIQWYVDGQLFETQKGGWYSPNGDPNAPFDKPFYLIMNLAIGGNYVGDPSLAAGSYEMQVDYVRAFAPTPTPEPSTLAALGGAAWMALRRRNRASRR